MKKGFTDLAMQKLLNDKEAIDISGCEVTSEGDYILTEFIDGKDYCNAETEQWIWSIGKHKETGEILASHGTKFYSAPEYECIWLR